MTFVNGGTGRKNQAEMGFELHDLEGNGNRNGNGKTENAAIGRSSSKTGNRTFWWDRKRTSEGDSESMEEIFGKSEVPAGYENTPPTGIMKSTRVTVSVEESRPSPAVQRSRSESTRQNKPPDRGVEGLSLDHSERLGRKQEEVDLNGPQRLDTF